MCVDLYIPVYVVEALTVGRIDIDGQLPCVAPVGNVLSCKGICGALQPDDDGLYCFWIFGLGKVEVAIGSVEDILLKNALISIVVMGLMG